MQLQRVCHRTLPWLISFSLGSLAASMAKKDRVPVPEDVATLLMFRSDRTCCVCHERGEPIQIHHIDEDPSNNDSDNLAVQPPHP